MSDQPGTADPTRPTPTPQDVRRAAIQVLVLLVLCGWALWPQLRLIVRTAIHNSDWAHTLALPIALIILVIRRRQLLAHSVGKGSVWGLVLLLGGLGMLAISTWPLSYAYFRVLAIVPVLAGVVLATAGWRVFKHCLPLLLLVLLAIPIGERKYASLIILPESYTLSATRAALDQLPGVSVKLRGQDMAFTRDGQSGWIALGESRRGASLLMAYACIGVFVAFVRVRPAWQVAFLAASAVPIVLLCNLLRIVTWGLVVIYGQAGATSPTPRGVAAVVSLSAAYVTFGLLAALLSGLFTDSEEEDEEEEGEEESCDE